MELTPNQIEQSKALIKKFKFCSIETQKELEKKDFFGLVVVSHFLIFIDAKDAENGKDDCICVLSDSIDAKFYTQKAFSYLPMPQVEEILSVLPYSIEHYALFVNKKRISYVDANAMVMRSKYDYLIYVDTENDNICEAAAKLWLKLHTNQLL